MTVRLDRLVDWIAALALCGVVLAAYYLINSRAWFVAFAAVIGGAGVIWLQRRGSRRTRR
jgi:Flp pilus assembly protein TadB